MKTYYYSDKETKPDIEKVSTDCVTAGLAEPLGVRWDVSTKIMSVTFENELTASEKITLDGIAAGV